MSPIASVPAAFAPTLFVALDPLTMSQYLAGTGGFVFAAVAIVSVAAYSYHGRGAADNPSENSTWVTFSSFLSSMRDWPPDVEGGFEQDFSMVYARFFHPMSWNLVECHPATTFVAPTIYAEDAANEIPASEPKSYGMNSFLDMDDDDGDGNGDKKASVKAVGENANQGEKPRVAKTPPYYDTSSATLVRFQSTIVGVTDRPGGAFLSMPGKYEDGSSDTSSSETSGSELDTCPAYDGILTKSELDLAFPPSDGVLKTPPRTPDSAFGTSPASGVASELAYPTDSYPHINRLAYDGTPTTLMRCTRRYGMAHMADLAQTLKQGIPKEGSGLGLVRTIGCQSGLCDLTDFDDTDSEADSATSYRHLERIKAASDKAISSKCDVGVHDNRDGAREDWSDDNMFAPPHKGPTLMRRILRELLDPNMDCTPRTLSKHSDFEFREDDIIDDDEGSVPRVTPTCGLAKLGWISLEWTSSTTRTENDVSNGGSVPLHRPRGLPRYRWALSALASIAWYRQPLSGPTRKCTSLYQHAQVRLLCYYPGHTGAHTGAVLWG